MREPSPPMEALTEHRIRQLAIAIQQMDSDDANRLLEHLPESLTKRIRSQLVLLENITQDERRLAVETIETLLQSDDLESLEKSASHRTELNPPVAVQDLAQKDLTHQEIAVEDYPIEAIVEVLGRERPIVIATILRNLPSRLGQSIVPRLNLDLAKEAVDWIPRLEATPLRVLDGLMVEFLNQVKSVGSKMENQHQGQEKVRELLSVLPTTSPIYAHADSEQAILGLANQNSAGYPAMATLKPEPESPFVIPLNRKTSREEALEVLLKLDDLDLLRVLYSHSAQDVKRFLAGANKALRLRIEKLTPRHALNKLRRELGSVPITDEKTWRELASQFVQTAIEITQTEPNNEDLRIPA